MAIPSSDKAVGQSGHTTDHNSIAAVLTSHAASIAEAAVLAGDNTFDGSQRLESDVTGTHPLTVWCDKGDAYGMAERFTVENTSGGGGCDVNFRNVDINVGEAGVGSYSTHLKFYNAPSTTNDTIRIFEAGSTTDLASKMTNAGTFLSYAKGLTSGAAFALSTWGDANQTFAIDADDGKIEWGAGGASALDTALYRDAASTLRTDAKFICQTIAPKTGNLSVQDSAASTAFLVRTTDVQFSKLILANKTGNAIQLIDGGDIYIDTTTGSRIGTNTSAKIGFYGATPVAKQSGVAVDAAGIHAALVNLGLIAA